MDQLPGPESISGEDLSGKDLDFGRVLSRARYHSQGYWLWNTQCDLCGRIRELSAGNIKRSTGKCPSCAQRNFDAPVTVDGKRTSEYVAWCGMRERCGYIKGPNVYVEKGITVYEGWLGPNGYTEFYRHIGPKPSPDRILDRIDNSGNYVPGNVRWATPSQSNSNKSDNVWVEIDGVSKILEHWCQDYGIYPEAVRSRMIAGWPIDKAITTPFRPERPNIDKYYIDLAFRVATRSTCARRAVGCVITDLNGYCISTGYNSVPKGVDHCTNKPCEGAFAPSGTALHLCMALHAEDVALMKCEDINKIDTIYVTASPCIHCTRRLLNTSTKRIVFAEEYPHPEAQLLWESLGRKWEKIA